MEDLPKNLELPKSPQVTAPAILSQSLVRVPNLEIVSNQGQNLRGVPETRVKDEELILARPQALGSDDRHGMT